jgi:DnaB helicase-like protein
MASERLSTALQENILTTLCHDDTNGKVILNLVDPALFEGDYRTVAEKAVEYWRQHGQAPKQHIGDLLSDILEDTGNRKAQTFRRILVNMLQLMESINTGYVLTQLRSFVRMQKLKGAILRSAEQLNSQQELAIGEVEAIWNELLRARDFAFEPGLRLTEPERIIEYLQTRHTEFSLGIQVLDERYIVPYRGGVLLFLAAAKRGKSWFLCNVGWNALMQRKKVVHISLEMPAEEVGMRYYQKAFSITKREAEVEVRTFKYDRFKQLVGFDIEKMRPDFTFESEYLRDELNARLDHFGKRMENLVIKKFPIRSLTPDGLRAYLDNLEITENFIPDMLILDYIGIMKTDARNHRVSLGRIFEEFRGIIEERNLAGITVHQISKAGAEAATAKSTNVAEDWSMIGTADQVAVFSQTEAEKRWGLGRLYVGQARGEGDGFGCVMTQSYATGQFCVDSIYLPPRYFDLIPDEKDQEVEDEDAQEE